MDSTIRKKMAARPRLPRYKWPASGRSQARKHGRMALNGRVYMSALLLDHPDLQQNGDLGMELEGNLVDPQGLDRLLEEYLPLVNLEAIFLQEIGDIRVGDRAVEH